MPCDRFQLKIVRAFGHVFFLNFLNDSNVWLNLRLKKECTIVLKETSMNKPARSNRPWRTLAYQEVGLRIGPLAKLGRFKSTADNFLVYIITISLASGLFRSLTSWYAKALHK